DGSSYTGLGLATVGLSKGYCSTHESAWILKTATTLIIGDSDLDGTADDYRDLSIAHGGALQMLNSSAVSDARIIMGGQAGAAQLNAYAAGNSPFGLLDQAGKWFVAHGLQDKDNVLDPAATAPHIGTGGGDNKLETVASAEWSGTKNAFKFGEGDRVATTSAAWKGVFVTTVFGSDHVDVSG